MYSTKTQYIITIIKTNTLYIKLNMCNICK